MVRRVVRASSQECQETILAPAGGRFVRPSDAYDEVYAGVLISDGATALSTNLLKDMRVTHVLNAAQGSNSIYYGGYINTNESYYDRVGIKFMGVPAQDSPSFYLRPYFKEAANFIDDAVRSGGKVVVHCQCGISRSATLVAAYLMLKKKMDVKQALASIRLNRSIFPNQGFLSQLCDFDYELRRAGDLPSTSGPVELDDSKPVKDSFKNRLSPGNRLPSFTSTNYFPLKHSLTKSGYAVTTDVDRHFRARSEERIPARYRSPSPSRFRSARARSVLPEVLSAYGRRSASPEPIDSYDTSPAVNYDTGRLPRQSYNYLSRPFEYAAPRPYGSAHPTGYRALQNMAYLSQYRAPSLERTLTPRDTQSKSSRPLESYTFSSPRYQRSFTTYTPTDRYTPRSYSSYTPSYRSSYLPSVLKYPSLLSPSLYSRIFKA